MSKAIGPHVFVPDLKGTETHPAYARVSARDLKLQEDWFRDAIFANPALVIDPCRQAGLVPEGEVWLPWETEFELDAGPMDVLLLASSGRVGIVETKLSYNHQKRREVVAQILDYALALQEADSLPPWPAEGPEPADVLERVARGDFLLIIAGDAIDPRALRLSEAVLAGHLTSEWDLAMVDLNLYQGADSAKPRHLLVPELRGVVRHETRQVVRVVTEGDRTRVKVERLAPPPPPGRTRRDWDEASFFEELKANVDEEDFAALRDAYDALHATYTISWGHGGKQGFIYASDPAHGWNAPLGFDSDGRLTVDPRGMPAPTTARVRKALGALGLELEKKQYVTIPAAKWRPRWKQILEVFDEARAMSAKGKKE